MLVPPHFFVSTAFKKTRWKDEFRNWLPKLSNISHAGASKLTCACDEGPGAPGNGAKKSGANHPVPRRAVESQLFCLRQTVTHPQLGRLLPSEPPNRNLPPQLGFLIRGEFQVTPTLTASLCIVICLSRAAQKACACGNIHDTFELLWRGGRLLVRYPYSGVVRIFFCTLSLKVHRWRRGDGILKHIEHRACNL